jgi:hypothetical protein
MLIWWIALYVSTVFLSAFLVAMAAIMEAKNPEAQTAPREIIAGCLIPVVNMLIAGIALAALVSRRKDRP